MLALDWAEDTTPVLEQFDFVFLILLRHVTDDKCLESIIIEQHGQLETMKVTVAEMKGICQEEPGAYIMYIFDGFDEYTFGTNSDIDRILVHGKHNTFVIISSRPGDFLQKIRQMSDEEVSITGFSQENVVKCASMYLGQVKIGEFFVQAQHSNLADLLHIPIILLMACAVFEQQKSLPRSVTKLFDQIVDMTMSRTTLKTMKKRAKEISSVEDLKVSLGKLAWTALQRESKQLLIFKVNKNKIKADILQCQMIVGNSINWSSIRVQF